METTIRRLPRMRGLTYLSISYQKLNSEEAYNNLLKHLVNNWALDGFRLNGDTYNIYELAGYLGLDPSVIMGHISNLGKNMGNYLEEDQIENTLKSIITLSTSWAMQDRGLIMKQAENLLSSQGEEYKPFISSEVNKALKLVLESNKNLMEGYKAFFTSNNNIVNILQLKDNKDNNKDQVYLSPDDAMLLIRGNKQQGELPVASEELEDDYTGDGMEHDSGFKGTVNPAGLDGKALKGLYLEHAVGDSPSVRERRSGTKSLMALAPESPEAKELNPDKPKRRESSHTNASRRRGEMVEDIDALP